MGDSEQLPVADARAGDAKAWDILFRRYQLPLYAYVMELVRHEQTALDVVQETFINAVRHLKSLREDARFGSWLFSIAHQKVVQQWRKQGREREWIADGLMDGEVEFAAAEAGPDGSLVEQEDSAELLAHLERLPLAQRSVLVLHYLEEFSLEEIASITEVPLGTVKSRLHHARTALRKQLEGTTR
ncbi:MAG TPA: sigma-70 family RNA polymerase sigma factor [Verrucomicrobiae bacterium]